MKEAKLKYNDNGIEVIEYGDYVKCVVSGFNIPVELLAYWSVKDQVPFVDAQASLEWELRNSNLSLSKQAVEL
jgi:hypothetical protein